MVAAPCGGTGREGGRGGGREGGGLGAHRPYIARGSTAPVAQAPRKKRLTQISVAVWRDLSRRGRGRNRNLAVCNRHACESTVDAILRIDHVHVRSCHIYDYNTYLICFCAYSYMTYKFLNNSSIGSLKNLSILQDYYLVHVRRI